MGELAVDRCPQQPHVEQLPAADDRAHRVQGTQILVWVALDSSSQAPACTSKPAADRLSHSHPEAFSSSEILHELRGRDRERIAELGGRLTATGDDPIMIAWKRMSGEPYFNYWRAYFEVFGIALRDQARYGHFLDGFVAGWLELLVPLLLEAGCPPERTESLGTLILASFRGLYMDLLVTGDRRRVDRAAGELALATRLLTDDGGG